MWEPSPARPVGFWEVMGRRWAVIRRLSASSDHKNEPRRDVVSDGNFSAIRANGIGQRYFPQQQLGSRLQGNRWCSGSSQNGVRGCLGIWRSNHRLKLNLQMMGKWKKRLKKTLHGSKSSSSSSSSGSSSGSESEDSEPEISRQETAP